VHASDFWKNDGRTTQRYVAYPCHGIGGVFPPQHTYVIYDCGGEKKIKLEAMSLEQAKQRFGEGNVFVTKSSACCADCLAFVRSLQETEVRSG
jgi:hypothetical protein